MILITKVARFTAYGIPAFIVAIPLNYLFVEGLQWSMPAAYALVLGIQVTLNFFICTLFVFKRDSSKSLRSQFCLFAAGILVFRALDWSLYSLLVKSTPIHYLAIQLFNTALFAFAKFAFARRTIEGGNCR